MTSDSRIHARSSGVFIISATPFSDDGALDLQSTDTLVDFYLGHGVSGMTILGMMGEAPKLTEEESLTFTRRVLQRVAGRVPVVVGVSHASNQHVDRLAKSAMDLGAAGVMLAPAPNLKIDDQVHGYYATVARMLGADVPICLQDFPQSTGVYTSVDVVNRLVDEFPQVVMFKHEDLPGLRKLTQIRSQAESAGRRRISILVGNGGLFLPQELLRGADGAMTGFAYPEMLVQVCALFAQAGRKRPRICSTPTFPCCGTSFSTASASRCARRRCACAAPSAVRRSVNPVRCSMPPTMPSCAD